MTAKPRTPRHPRVVAPDGTSLFVLDAGLLSAPPVVLLHGISQCHRSFARLLDSLLTADFRVVVPDLRGHGASDKPAAGYEDRATWAGDVAAVLSGLALRSPVLCGWSYGGIVALDYVATHGDGALAGLLFTGSPSLASRSKGPPTIGPDFLESIPGLMSDDLGVAVPAVSRFVRASAGNAMSDAEFYETLGFNLAVPAAVRRQILRRAFDHSATLRTRTRPATALHGDADRVILPTVLDQYRDAGCSCTLLPGRGHGWFEEDPAPFVAAVRALRP